MIIVPVVSRSLFNERTGVTSDEVTGDGATSDKKHYMAFHEFFC